MTDRSEQDRQGARQTAYNVELHIDEIVLHGFAHRDRFAIQEAIHSELTRLLAESGMLSSQRRGNDAERLDAGTVTMHRDMPPTAIGAQVAQAVYRGLEQHGGQPVSNGNTGRSAQ